MSSSVLVMTGFLYALESHRRPAPYPSTHSHGWPRRWSGTQPANRSLTVPLLCCRWPQIERSHQIQRCVAHAHLVQRRPQVDHVPLALATGIEALVLVEIEVDAEGAATAIAAMDRTGAARLHAAPL